MERAEALKRFLLAEAERRGLSPAGVAPAAPAETAPAFRSWLAAGYAGEMGYLERTPERRSDPRICWPETRSILVAALPYRALEEVDDSADDPRRGRIALYARGDDYHHVLLARLQEVLQAGRTRDPGLEGRAYVDTGPLLERDLAARAGLGWFGKNTCLLNRRAGSYFFLGALLLNRELPPDGPVSAHCGTCRRCLDVCPTGAFVGPYVLDARRCISYLTIELRGPIPAELRPAIGNWIFGCDLCQEVCPWNRKAARGEEQAFRPREDLAAPALVPLLSLTREEFNNRFRESPIRRARWAGLLRNVCVALGNSGDRHAVPALIRCLEHEEPLVRGHAAWALGRLDAGRGPLRTAALREVDDWVRSELEAALQVLASSRCDLGAAA